MKGLKCHRCGAVYRSSDELICKEIPDPYSTGDMGYVVMECFCPACRSETIEEIELCEACEMLEAFEDYEDCAECIITKRYSHLKDYDAEIIDAAQRFLRGEAA